MRALLLVAIFSLVCPVTHSQTVSPLFARGYTVIPQPQRVSLRPKDFTFDRNSQLRLDKGVRQQDSVLTMLREDLVARFQVRFDGRAPSKSTLSFRIEPGSVPVGSALDQDKQSLQEQAYRIELHPGSVAITANAATGLFYGAETFLQLLREEKGMLWLPEGTIEDWPDLHLRHIYWDDSHHLEKVDELKRVVRQAAFYKINGFVIKLDGHFQYKSASAVVEPYALTPTELQDVTNYGLRYHIQVIPYLDGPAHIAFVLKHPEYASLREFPESNYEICATNPESYKLLQGMYQDLQEANKGVNYFYLSTDEPYYLGLAHNSQCDEEAAAKQAGSPGQVFAQFVNKTGGYFHDRGRTVIFWGEYPLKPNDIPALPRHLVNGEVYGPEFDRAFRQQGIQQMIFTSVEGEEKLFPAYSILPQSERLHPNSTPEEGDGPSTPRLESISTTISFDSSRLDSSLIGEINAGWADEGVHPETFWLGYVAAAAAGWHPASPSRPELESSFYSLFYGARVVDMDLVYQLMSEQAQSWTDSWDGTQSTARKPIWGSSDEIFETPKLANDQTLPLPPLPGENLEYHSNWATENARRIALAAQANQTNGRLLSLLHENLLRSSFNRYNLEVYLTIAELCRQNFEMIENINRIDSSLAAASQSRNTDPAKSLREVDNALDIARSIRHARDEVLGSVTATWYKSWFPRVEEANGRRFLQELDDVKDHLPDRTIDMSYLIYREKLLPFGDWVDAIACARNRFAIAHHFPIRDYYLAWDDLSLGPGQSRREPKASVGAGGPVRNPT